MKTINIFIACSPTSDILADQKAVLSKKCRELNTELAEIGKGFYINPISYEDPERRMEVFKKHIRKDDIAIFLFDNEQDTVLLDECDQAVKRNNDLNKPEVLVFASDKIKENKEYDDKVKQICADGGWLYEPLKNTEDLWDNVKEKIFRYVRSYERIKDLRFISKARYVGLRGLIIGLFIAIPLIIWLTISLYRAESKRLLIVGGGSARNYIEEVLLKQEKGLSTEYWLYAPMPSGDAYRMMAEDVINNKDFNSHPYFPIVVSAGKAQSDSVFRRTIEPNRFIDHGIVVGLYVGDDYLVVYRGNGACGNFMRGDDATLQMMTLDSLIACQSSLLLKSKDSLNTIVYTTNKNSGTLNSYKNRGCNSLDTYIGLCDSLKQGYVFSSIDSLSSLTSKKWIALGSKYYRTLDDTTRFKPLTVLDDMSNKVIKPIYVYFMLYKDKGLYRLPEATKDFLTRLGVEDINTILSVNDSVCKNSVLYDNFIFDSLKKKDKRNE